MKEEALPTLKTSLTCLMKMPKRKSTTKKRNSIKKNVPTREPSLHSKVLNNDSSPTRANQRFPKKKRLPELTLSTRDKR